MIIIIIIIIIMIVIIIIIIIVGRLSEIIVRILIKASRL